MVYVEGLQTEKVKMGSSMVRKSRLTLEDYNKLRLLLSEAIKIQKMYTRTIY